MLSSGPTRERRLPMPGVKTDLLTQDNLRVYDLDPMDPRIRAVAGPDGYDPDDLDINNLPPGFRRIDVEEWEELHNQM
jgi:hypothetical protein